jgi:hypothetical protein
MRSRLPPWLPIALAAALAGTGACETTPVDLLPGQGDQTVQPNYPRGIALSPDGDQLVVVSSNFEGAFDTGAVLLADLRRLGADLAFVPLAQASSTYLEDIYVDAVFIPSFGTRPVFADDGERFLVAAQGDNLLLEIEVLATGGADGGVGTSRLTCRDEPPAAGATELCTADGSGAGNPLALSLDQNDPYELVLYDQTEDQLLGAATFLSASRVTFFRVRENRTGQNRLQLRGSLELGEGVQSLRSVVLHPRGAGQVPLLVAALEREDPVFTTQTEVELIWLDPSQREDAVVRRLDLEALTGARSARALTSSPDGDALFLFLRNPDGIARLDTDPVGSTIAPRLGGVSNVCEGPTSMRFARIPLPDGDTVDRLLVVCYRDNTVAAYNPLTLEQTDAVRMFGLGPFDLAVDTTGDTPRLFVSFFDEDTIGVFDLVDAAGDARLVPRARIGIPDDREARQ